jgi:hypothetical protein
LVPDAPAATPTAPLDPREAEKLKPPPPPTATPAQNATAESAKVWGGYAPSLTQGDNAKALADVLKKPFPQWTPEETQFVWSIYRESQMSGMPQGGR